MASNVAVKFYATDSEGALLPEVPWLVHAPQATNGFWNSHVPVTQDIAGLTGDHVCWLEGAGTVTMSGGATGVVSDGVPITFDPAGATVTFTVSGGPPGLVQVEGGTVPTYPIITEDSAVTRDSCALSFDAANHDDAGGVYTLDVVVTGSCKVLGDFLSYDPDTGGGQFVLTDGTNSATATGHVPGEYSIQIDYDATAGTMSLSVDEGAPVDAAYDGTLPVGARLTVFDGSAVVGKVRDLKRYAA